MDKITLLYDFDRQYKIVMESRFLLEINRKNFITTSINAFLIVYMGLNFHNGTTLGLPTLHTISE